jgi:hypothetical protein
MVIFYIVVCSQVMGTKGFNFDDAYFVVMFLLDAFLVVWSGFH